VSRPRAVALRAALLLAILLAWLPALDAPFTYDDRIEVIGNRTIRWIDDIGTIAAYNTSRPLLIFTYALNWRLGGLDPFGYHVVSLAIHALNALLAWRFAGRLLSPGRAAFAAAAWALHPMTTESATYITGRSDALQATWWLLGLTAWLDFRRAAPDAPARWLGPRSIAVASVVAALLTKEVGALLPVALLAVDRWLVATPRWRDHAPFWIAGAGAVALRLAVYGWPAAEVPRGAIAQLLSQAEVWARYLQLWLAPAGQSILHDHPGLARVAGALALGGWALAAAVLARAARGEKPGSPAALRVFALALFGAWLFASSAVPLLETMAEHRAYLAGFAVLLALSASIPDSRASRALALTTIPVLFAATVLRNRTWADETTLWADAAAQNPDSARAWYGAGEALRHARRFPEAAAAYARAAELDPADVDAAINLGIVRAESGDEDGARAAWQAVLRRAPTSCAAHNNLAGLAFRAGRLDEATASYTATLGWCAEDPIAHLNLGNLAWQRADARAAAFHYRAYLQAAEDGPAAPLVLERLRRMNVQ